MKKEQKTVEQVYQEDWKDIVEKDGVIDVEQVKMELADFSFMLEQVPLVYSELVGLSKPNYYASAIIGQHKERYLAKGTTKDDISDMIADHTDLDEFKEELIEYFEITSDSTHKD